MFLASRAILRAVSAALVTGVGSFGKSAALMIGPGVGPGGGGEAASGGAAGRGSRPVEGEPAGGVAAEGGDDCLRRLGALVSGVRGGWALFLGRGAVRGLGLGVAAGVELDAPAVVAVGVAAVGVDSSAGVRSSSTLMTRRREGEAELALERGGEGRMDASSDMVVRSE